MGFLDWLHKRSTASSGSTQVPAPPSVPPGTSSLSGLLDALEEVAEAHAELFDTDVRERIWAVIERRYVKLDSGYEIPHELGMHSDQGNRALCAALEHHVRNLVTIAEIFKLDTEAKRLRSFQNPAVKSQHHRYKYDDFFGAP